MSDQWAFLWQGLPDAEVLAWLEEHVTASAAWASITGKPSTFPPDAHNHDDRYPTAAEVAALVAAKQDAATAATDAELAAKADASAVPRFVNLGSPVPVSGNNTYADITGLAVPVTNAVPCRFQFQILWSGAAGTTGARFALNGPSFTRLAYVVRWNTTASAVTQNLGNSYNQAHTVGTDSATHNLAVIEGVIVPSASGPLIARFANEVNGSAVTAQAGSSVLYW